METEKKASQSTTQGSEQVEAGTSEKPVDTQVLLLGGTPLPHQALVLASYCGSIALDAVIITSTASGVVTDVIIICHSQDLPNTPFRSLVA